MLTSLSFVFLVGLSMGWICNRIKLPKIIGMLVTGIVLGPYVLDLLDSSILHISAELRQMALIIILLRAGLTLDIGDLKAVGRPAVLMAFLPASFEILAFTLLAPSILGVTRIEALVMGAVLGAVSPAVVVPRMVKLIETGYGTKKAIPQLILAGASCDDVFVIVLFTTFVGMESGGSVNVMDFANIPISIVLGVLLGGVVGYVLSLVFENAYRRGRHIRNSVKVIVILGFAFALMGVETHLEQYISISGLLAVMSMASVIRIKSEDVVTERLSQKFGKIWIAAELLLFVLVGAAVDIRYTMTAGAPAVLMIFLALLFRSLGVMLSLMGTNLNYRERLFCIISYLPKATVQAAIGSVPLSMGLPSGQMILSVAVLAILITAPLGAIGMDLQYEKLLTRDSII